MTNTETTPATPEGDAVSRAAVLALFQPETSMVRKRICDDVRALPALRSLPPQDGEREKLRCQLKTARKIIAKVYGRVALVVSELVDEDDKVSFGSTNHADILRDLDQEWAESTILKADILTSEQEAAAFKARAEKAEARVAELENALDSRGKELTAAWHRIEALTAQPVAQESVAWHARWTHNGLPQVETFQTEKMAREYWGHKPSFEAVPLYAHPATPAPFLPDMKLFDPADSEALDWVEGHLSAIRRDNGNMDYSLKGVVRAFQAGKASATPAPVEAGLPALVGDTPSGGRVRFAVPAGATRDEMRDWLRTTDVGRELYQHGDCLLVWANEGDLFGCVPMQPEEADLSHLAWIAHNPGDLPPDRVNVICPDADVVILANIERFIAIQIVADHSAALRAQSAPVGGEVKG